MAALVISVSGVPRGCKASGMFTAFGVGSGGGGGSAVGIEARPFLGAGAALRFLGDGFFGGDNGSGAMDASGSSNSDRSILSSL